MRSFTALYNLLFFFALKFLRHMTCSSTILATADYKLEEYKGKTANAIATWTKHENTTQEELRRERQSKSKIIWFWSMLSSFGLLKISIRNYQRFFSKESNQEDEYISQIQLFSTLDERGLLDNSQSINKLEPSIAKM